MWKDLEKNPDAESKWENFWKSLDDWGRDNINQDTLPQPEWNRMQVAAWARKVLNLTEKSAKILIEEEITGHSLLSIPNLSELKSYGFRSGAATSLWAEIEKMKKYLAEPGKQRNSQSLNVALKFKKLFEYLIIPL